MNEFWGNVRFIGRLFRELWRILFCMALLLMCGCMNLWTRNPLTDTRIQRCYQSTSTMACGALIVAFPQMMSDVPSDSSSFNPWNILTIPCGCLVMCDAACEAVVDTVCLPVDWPLSRYRKQKWEAWSEAQQWEMIDEDEDDMEEGMNNGSACRYRR